MVDTNWSRIKQDGILSFSHFRTRPGSILIAILMYFLGVGISDYLGNTIDWVAYWIGLSNSILLLISSQLLDVFFRSIDANPTGKLNLLSCCAGTPPNTQES